MWLGGREEHSRVEHLGLVLRIYGQGELLAVQIGVAA